MKNEIIKIPHGNTQKGVNIEIFNYISKNIKFNDKIKVLDVPCGKGEFLEYFHYQYPLATLFGFDIGEKPASDYIYFKKTDLSKNFPEIENTLFDMITSISGIMMFGNTQFFVNNCCENLKSGGTIIITNDNTFSIRDRLSYLFFGKLRRFNLLFERDEKITQLVLPQEILRILMINNIQIRDIRFAAFYLEDIIYLPLALLIYPIQIFYALTRKSEITSYLKNKLFGFKSLFYRHYIIIGEKT